MELLLSVFCHVELKSDATNSMALTFTTSNINLKIYQKEILKIKTLIIRRFKNILIWMGKSIQCKIPAFKNSTIQK